MKKVKAGQHFSPPPAADQNLIIDSAEDYRRRILGVGADTSKIPTPTDIIRVRNSSSSHRRAGEVLETEIRGLLTTDVNPQKLWINAALPTDLARWGILRKDLPSNEIGEMQTSGVCRALVNIQNSTDRRAGPVAGSAILKSGSTGPLKLLYAPDGTGERTCVVQFDAESTPSLPRGFNYQSLQVNMTTLGATYIWPFINSQNPPVAVEVVYDSANFEFVLSGTSKWFHHLHGQVTAASTIATNRWIVVEMWVSWATTIPAQPFTWTNPAHKARWMLPSSTPVGVSLDTRTYHQISSQAQADGRRFRVACRAVSNMPDPINLALTGYLSWHEIKQGGAIDQV